MLQRTLVESLSGGVEMQFLYIPRGKFLMGAPESDGDAYDRERPQHEVNISKGFYLGKYLVTQGQWEGVMGTRPWSGQDSAESHEDCPVVHVSWEDTQAFVGKLNERGNLYRLPSEAEWEYSCRAGASSRWSFGDDERTLRDYAWYDENAWEEQYAHHVGMKQPNTWGLYDMYGNVYEWCGDWYGPYASKPQVDPIGPPSGSFRVSRGGAFFDYGLDMRSTFRKKCASSNRLSYVGFRLLKVSE